MVLALLILNRLGLSKKGIEEKRREKASEMVGREVMTIVVVMGCGKGLNVAGPGPSADCVLV
jgi:hypothetical protein